MFASNRAAVSEDSSIATQRFPRTEPSSNAFNPFRCVRRRLLSRGRRRSPFVDGLSAERRVGLLPDPLTIKLKRTERESWSAESDTIPRVPPQRVMARLLRSWLSLARSFSCRLLSSVTLATVIWPISVSISQYTAACLRIATLGAFSFDSTAGTRTRSSSNAFRSSIRLWRSMLLCRLLFSVSSSSSEELLEAVGAVICAVICVVIFAVGDVVVVVIHRPTLFRLWYVLWWRARFAGFCSCWAVRLRAGFDGGLPRGLGAGVLSLNAVFTVNWKCCWSAGLG